MSLDTETLLYASAVLAGAGLVKGVSGFGIPLIGVPLLAMRFSVAEAVTILVLPMLLSNAWQVLDTGLGGRAFRRFWWMALLLAAGTLAGSYLLSTVADRIMLLVVGTVAVLFSVYSLARPTLRLAPPLHVPVGILSGSAAGVLNGMTGVAGPALLPYLLALHLPREDFIATVGSLYLVSSLVLGLALGGFGILDATGLGRSAIAVVPLFVGMGVGLRLRRYLSENAFRRVVLVLLVLVGLNILRRNLLA